MSSSNLYLHIKVNPDSNFAPLDLRSHASINNRHYSQNKG